MGIYEKVQYVVGKDTSVLQCGRLSDKTVNVRPNLPGNVIVIHGVNDVGTAYNAVEQGLCQGLKKRIGWDYVAGTYRMPTSKDKDEVLADPDDVFFKRKIDDKTDSPIIPFYWGFREETPMAGSLRGQRIDRNKNRLDKDLSKGGGPFANATSTLPDMWGQGKSSASGMLDFVQRDATHPVLDNPGHLYMILAAKRLAALISMIRDYDEDEAVTLVAHSQGCMVSLLAQAFLLDDSLRPADTLILNNPPYSLVDEIPTTTSLVEGTSGEDTPMHGHYGALKGRQTLHARLTTLVNIVHGVVSKKHATPAFTSLNDHGVHHGMVSGLWKASADRDNRGKVYLYFCPEDMTVALNNVQGIGWQGIPDYQHGKQVGQIPVMKTGSREFGPYDTGRKQAGLLNIMRQPFKELTAHNAKDAGFYQRVFTNKLRPTLEAGTPVLIGQAKPHDFEIVIKGEDDQGHTEISDPLSNHYVRAHFQMPDTPWFGTVSTQEARVNIRSINGEPLPVAVKASLNEGARPDAKGRPGASEDVDPIDAAIAITSDYGMSNDTVWELHPDPSGHHPPPGKTRVVSSLNTAVYAGSVMMITNKVQKMQTLLNIGKPDGQICKVWQVFDCMGDAAKPAYTGKVMVSRSKTPDEERLRWQKESGARSFHGAIFGGAANHRQVTAFDIAIGGGKAATDPLFFKYLCAVADWRLKQDKASRPRASILQWDDFIAKYTVYWKDEPQWRKDLIEGNAIYYSSGTIPACVPTLDGMPSPLVCETLELASLKPRDETAPAPMSHAKTGKGGI
ncbi:T6SS effector phospholipase Tle3 domain-containing protein [Duganella hordei]|uniref:T6SS effector phospholipase Tle3 domain-containing protein n=1 Tax=Duganella hordei TaxID=2865934 RepID=UPI0030EA01A9